MSEARSLRALALVLGTIIVIAAQGCSGTSSTRGEVVIAIQTDLSLPKDVSSVRIQVSTLGVTRFDNTYPVGPDPSMRIPATLGLLAGDNPNAPIRIRVVGFRKEFAPRILREVVTTVPPSRVVSLRLPLQYVSDGSAVLDPLSSGDPFAFVNACPEGKTNIGGDCKDSSIDSSSLPDYVPADVFGGGDANGQGGTCFDTQPCMRNGATAFVAQAADGSCTVAAPPGDSSMVNVALASGASGDGICADDQGAAPCFVPLDRVDDASDLGWTIGDGGSVHLPRGACRKLAANEATLIVSTSCPTKTAQHPTCGAWSSVTSNGGVDAGPPPIDAAPSVDAGGDGGRDGGQDSGPSCLDTQSDPKNCGVCGHSCGGGMATCTNGACDPVTIAKGYDHTGSIAVDATDVYFSNGYAFTGGTIERVAKAGGTPTSVATGLSYPGGVSIDNGQVFFTSYGSPPNGFIYAVSATPASPTQLAPNQNYPLGTAAGGGYVYWITGAGGNVSRVSEAGGTIEPIYSGAARTTGGVAIDASYTYWTEYDLGKVERAAIGASPTPVDVETGLTQPGSIAVDATGVYFATGGTMLNKAPLAGGALIWSISAPVSSIATDGTHVYFTGTDGFIYRVSTSGGTASQIAAAPGADGIALDAGFVYWTTWTNGTVQRVAK